MMTLNTTQISARIRAGPLTRAGPGPPARAGPICPYGVNHSNNVNSFFNQYM